MGYDLRVWLALVGVVLGAIGLIEIGLLFLR